MTGAPRGTAPSSARHAPPTAWRASARPTTSGPLRCRGPWTTARVPRHRVRVRRRRRRRSRPPDRRRAAPRPFRRAVARARWRGRSRATTTRSRTGGSRRGRRSCAVAGRYGIASMGFYVSTSDGGSSSSITNGSSSPATRTGSGGTLAASPARSTPTSAWTRRTGRRSRPKCSACDWGRPRSGCAATPRFARRALRGARPPLGRLPAPLPPVTDEDRRVLSRLYTEDRQELCGAPPRRPCPRLGSGLNRGERPRGRRSRCVLGGPRPTSVSIACRTAAEPS